MVLSLVLTLLCSFDLNGSVLPLKPLKIGCLFQKTENIFKYYTLKASVDVAKSDLNHLAQEFGYEIKYHVRDSGCSEIKASGAAGQLIHTDKVDSLMGTSCSRGCVPIGYIAAFNLKPIISYGCSSALLSDKTFYPTFARTRPFAREMKHELAHYIDKTMTLFKWKNLGIIYSSSDVWSSTYEQIIGAISNSTMVHPTFALEIMHNRREYMELMKEHSRVILFVCYETDVAELLSYAFEMGMYNGEYAFITIDFFIEEHWKKESWYKTDEIFEGILNIGVMLGKEAMGPVAFADFERNLSKIAMQKYGYSLANKTYYEGAGYVYDAVKGYLVALHKTLTQSYNSDVEGFIKTNKIDQFLQLNNLKIDQLESTSLQSGRNWKFPANWSLSKLSAPVIPYDMIKKNMTTEPIIKDGLRIIKNLFNSSFKGMTGHVHISAEGDRYPLLILDNLQRKSNGFEFVRSLEYDTYEKIFTHSGGSIIWPGGGTEAPNAIPECGFEGELCISTPEQMDVMLLVAAVASPFGAMLVFFCLYRAYRNHLYEKDLMNQDIIFKFEELEIPELKVVRRKQTRLERMRKLSEDQVSPSIAGSDVSTTSEKNAMLLSPKRFIVPVRRKRKSTAIPCVMPNLLENVGKFNRATGSRVFFGILRDDHVFIKQIFKPIVILNREILIELKEIRDLHHPNLNMYCGVCPGAPHVLLASPVCKKGSLINILMNEDIQLNWVFRNTFMMDIAYGLAAIHDSPIKLHGHLTSKNILIDSRWNCKISDYGFRKFKELHEYKSLDVDDEERYEGLLWTAPENIHFPKSKVSKEGDIYSFGIIMSEIVNRLPPFSTYAQYKTRDYVHFVNKRCIPPFRPHVRLQTGLDGRVLELMRACWDEFPENRPSIHDVKSTLKSINKTEKSSSNLIDNMIDMMEKYAQGLEANLREVKHEKDMETEKVDKLIYSALPPVVATELRKGQQTAAQKFKTATVMLLKVDDFSNFVETLSPQQVVDLLNDVYVCVTEQSTDDKVHQLSGYRDRQVFVCGLPDSVKKKHAYYIAKTALKIMGSLTTFRFRHINDDLMKFKIVLHTGTFVAGLVGMNVPVFTLFGRTMEYAESLLEATPFLRILVTNECKEFLDLFKVAQFERTVPIMVKGIGVIQVNYLTGMKGVNVKLRNPMIQTASESLVNEHVEI